MNSTIKASEYCYSVFDGTHATPKPCNKGYKLITSKHISNNILDCESAYFISEHDYIEINKRSKINQWDILFSMIGTVGDLYLEQNKNIDYAIKNIGVFSCRNELKAKWLYFYLRSPLAQNHIKRFLNGAVQKFLSLKQLRDFPVLPFDEDKIFIVDILSTIDQKIAINNQINAQLEQIAKTLYDYWFVQFDFPDENGKPYKSSGGEMVYNETLKREIPKGWEVKSLGEITQLSVGREDANFATENGQYPFFTCAEKNLKCDIFAFNTKAILLAGNGSFSVKRYKGKFNAYQRTYVLEPTKDILYSIVYFLVKDNVEKFISGSRGSIIKFITKGDIENIQIALPNDLNFSKIINIYLSHAETLEKQNQQLTQLRDFLLPMLMNGQVSINSTHKS